MKTIILACSAGMSTSLLVTKMQEAAANQDYPATIFAVSVSELILELEKTKADVVLLGPQVGYMEEEFKGNPKLQGIPLAVINMMDYGMMNGKKVLQQAKDLIGELE
ncbi:PTS system cellobiose-specific IIB component [Streptococcus rupicaprae]|uniref:PTS system cellobiose-specific IIB component n=1 Tax=Streptococcus rupicaprae TaxID=759619 RepID=A0ABV2FIV1_9STRE